jgi:hypothetical protein
VSVQTKPFGFSNGVMGWQQSQKLPRVTEIAAKCGLDVLPLES